MITSPNAPIGVLVAQQTLSANTALRERFRSGRVPTTEHIEELIAQRSFDANHVLEAAFEKDGLVVDCGTVGDGHSMIGIYKKFRGPNNSPMLLIKIIKNGSTFLFIGSQPSETIKEVKEKLDEMLSHWHDKYPNVTTGKGEGKKPIMPATWRANIFAGLEKIEAARPPLSHSRQNLLGFRPR